MLYASQHTFTKEQLFADLQTDGVHVGVDILNKARRGDSDALYNIGILYLSKDSNEDKILLWFLLSAAENNPEAQFHLGMLYHYGQHAPIDYKLAMEWYLKAAKQSHSYACMEIGYLYRDGCGVPANEQLAFHWYGKSKEAAREKSRNQPKNTLNLISSSEELPLNKETRAIKEKTLNIRNQVTEKQELTRKNSMIQALTKENERIQERTTQETRKMDDKIKDLEQILNELNQSNYEAAQLNRTLEDEKQQILKELDQAKYEAAQRNKTLEEKLESKNKQVTELQNEKCNLQNLLKIKAYAHEEYQQEQQKMLYERESNTAALLEQNQDLLDQVNTLKASSTQFEQEARSARKDLFMLQAIYQSLCDSKHQVTKMTEHLEKSIKRLEKENERLEESNQSLRNSNNQMTKRTQDLERSNETLEISKERLEISKERLEKSNQRLEESNQHLEESNQRLEESNQRLEESNQRHADILKQEKQKRTQEVESLKQENLDLEKKMSNLVESAKKPNVTLDSDPHFQNIIKQKDRKIKELDMKLQSLCAMYDQKIFEAHEMMTFLHDQRDTLEDENQYVKNELDEKMMCEKKLITKIEFLELEVRQLKGLSASFEYETSV